MNDEKAIDNKREVELLPCPFCGGKALGFMTPGRVGCGTSECELYARTMPIPVWNTRSASSELEAGDEAAYIEAVKFQIDRAERAEAEVARLKAQISYATDDEGFCIHGYGVNVPCPYNCGKPKAALESR